MDDGALRDYRAVLALDPRRPGVHFRLGRVLLARSQRGGSDGADEAEALKAFQQELAVDPTHASAAYEIGELHRKAGRLDNAREFFETALTHYPEFEEARVALGRTLVALSKPELAVPHLQKAIALNPSSEVAYYQLAQAYRALGDAPAQAKALAAFERLQSASPRQSDPANLSRREVTAQTLETKPPRK
jgi:tetratricopeptide (TPR) repeat protein